MFCFTQIPSEKFFKLKPFQFLSDNYFIFGIRSMLYMRVLLLFFMKYIVIKN